MDSEISTKETKEAKSLKSSKYEGIRLLKELAMAHNRTLHPTLPESARSTRTYNDRTANGLTRCIIDFLNFSGHQAERTNCIGKMIDDTKIMTDILGDRRSIGSIKWLPTSGQKGTADISATIWGKSVKIEVKMKDRQSENQKRYQEQVERAGGLYWIVRSFDEFLSFYNELV